MKSVHGTKSSQIPNQNGVEEIHILNKCDKVGSVLFESLNSDVIYLLMHTINIPKMFMILNCILTNRPFPKCGWMILVMFVITKQSIKLNKL